MWNEPQADKEESMNKLEMQQCVLGPVYTNCYFLMNKETKELLIADPADQPDKIEAVIQKMGGKPVGILLTHGHYDHIEAVVPLKEKYQVTIYACQKEEEVLADPMKNLTGFHPGGQLSLKADRWLEDLEVFEAAGFSIQMLHTPGHTQGSCCYYLKEENILISGDTLFCGSVGRTDLPTGSTSQIIRSLHRLLESLPEDTQVYPGHESMTTIGYEKRYNPFV